MILVIIAAGEGSRVRSLSSGKPKTLFPVNGKPLISHLLYNCSVVGITQVVVVTGYQHRVLENYLLSGFGSLSIEIIHNPQWKMANGVSVLTAKAAIPQGEPFILSMSDHYYESDLLKKVLDSDLAGDGARVALDFNLDQIFDIDDAMKVTVDRLSRLKVTAMSKELDPYDAVDCGVFKCEYDFFNALEIAQKSGNCSLADACNILIKEGSMGGINIGDSFWLDLDTPEAWNHLATRR
ncbi:MAG: sugar phosphate nucleotidyltransferase [Fidelibacterota bacterium]